MRRSITWSSALFLYSIQYLVHEHHAFIFPLTQLNPKTAACTNHEKILTKSNFAILNPIPRSTFTRVQSARDATNDELPSTTWKVQAAQQRPELGIVGRTFERLGNIFIKISRIFWSVIHRLLAVRIFWLVRTTEKWKTALLDSKQPLSTPQVS